MMRRCRCGTVVYNGSRYTSKLRLFWEHPKRILLNLFQWTKSRQWRVTVLLCMMLVLFLHFRILPRSMGYYNDNCYLSPKEAGDMKFLLSRIAEAFNQENVTYWLDYGTLLGVWRTGEILKYDGDIDIARLFTGLKEDIDMISRVKRRLSVYNITVNPFQAKYNGKAADLVRMKVHNQTQNIKTLKIWYPFKENLGVVERFFNYLLPMDSTFDLIFPTRVKTVYGVKMNIPNKPLEVLKTHYPLTWFISFPYKWKCWL